MNDFETLKAEYDKRCIEIIYLKESARKSADEAASALDLLSRIRFALGDNGVRMQDELIAYCAEIRDAMARVAELDARISEGQATLKRRNEECDSLRSERDHYGQILTDLLDAMDPHIGRFADGEPIDPLGHAYDDACEKICRDILGPSR